MAAVSPEAFSKILVARFSPTNGCRVPDGEALYVQPRADVPMKDHVPHFFVSTKDHSTRSRYGWVQEIDVFTLDDFVRERLNGAHVDDALRAHLRTMLGSITRLPAETPVAATYSRRGVDKRQMDFEVHRVIFHRGKSE